ncbi:hypothetical protein [[Mycobacterium] nativiensis]|uniref:Transposase n=1 Tax=[Mycobacterium] nativiensis TaxID=2855503 RepID=A0ABU5XVT5_9MYCO|nr:hypothetical protein [Mycolicibacter sp. MYC340]MEB3031857.1 hypothetical protein [Mycolicibacter sp. MYC340]
MIEIREMLRVWMSGAGLRRVGELAGVDRKTARRYTDAAVAAGLDRDGEVNQLTDELIGTVIAAVRPDRPNGHERRGSRCAPRMIRSSNGSARG